MTARFQKNTELTVPVDQHGHVYVRDLYDALGKMPNGGEITEISSYNVVNSRHIYLNIRTDKGDVRDA